MPSSSPPVVLAFAASDPTSGAGLQADLLTIAALGCHPLSVVTALTAQDTRGVERMLPVEAAWITQQARAVLDDIAVQAFKAGVLGSAQNVRAVSELVAEHGAVPFVVDPVLASGRGERLAQGLEPAEAARDAQHFTWESLAAGFKPGGGQHLPNRLYRR